MNHQLKTHPGVRPAQLAPGAHGGGVRRTPPGPVYPRPRRKSRHGPGVACRIHTPTGARTVGFFVEGPDGLELVKHVRESRHLFRAADAWGVDLGLVERAREEGVSRIRLDETEHGICYSTSPGHLLQHGFRKDFGHGAQVFLPRSQWSQTGAGQLGLLMH